VDDLIVIIMKEWWN